MSSAEIQQTDENCNTRKRNKQGLIMHDGCRTIGMSDYRVDKLAAMWDPEYLTLAQPIRLLLKYAGEDFKQDTYTVGAPPDYSKESWHERKATLGIPFVNLPYYIDGDIKITQSNAILTYIGRKHNLLGETEQEIGPCRCYAESGHGFSQC